MLNKINEKKGNAGAIALTIVGVIAVGAYANHMGWIGSDNNPLNTAQDLSSSDSLQVYASNVVSSLGTVTSTGVGADEVFKIEIDKDDLVADSNLGITLTTSQYIPDGTNVDSTMVQPHTIRVPFTSDIEVSDSSGEDYILFDESASLIDGQKDLKQFTYTSVTPVEVPTTLAVNPNSFLLSNAVELDEIGEKETYYLDYGLKNKIELVIKN